MLFKILHGDKARISTDITPYHEGYCYVTHDGDFYVDMNNERVKLNAKDAETIMGMSLDELKNEIATQDAVILHEAQAYTDDAIKAYVDDVLSDYDIDVDSLVLITTDDIDTICGTTIQVASVNDEGVTF